LILAIRTGSATYSHRVLASTWAKQGYTSENGQLTKDGSIYPVREEIDLFNMLDIPYNAPENRNMYDTK
jgi:DNA polymerase/3'-5' exonuclease PolX